MFTASRDDNCFISSLYRVPREIINRNHITKSPELLAWLCDSLLRKYSKSPEKSDFENIVKGVVTKVCIRLNVPIKSEQHGKQNEDEIQTTNDRLFEIRTDVIYNIIKRKKNMKYRDLINEMIYQVCNRFKLHRKTFV
ncbi:hypothetical protein C2G38_2170965 [Gigaspora rosea]|uniref:Uncharacterized protein n=1 Tax=Gigaspora rosea TaxID=44941 RepID=A0A397VQK0_9GLOM|nr:hypothetical protein C2G38_2170965 [Gigaspora rosea]